MKTKNVMQMTCAFQVVLLLKDMTALTMLMDPFVARLCVEMEFKLQMRLVIQMMKFGLMDIGSMYVMIAEKLSKDGSVLRKDPIPTAINVETTMWMKEKSVTMEIGKKTMDAICTAKLSF